MTKEEIIKYIADNNITISKNFPDKLTRWLTHTVIDTWIVYDREGCKYSGDSFESSLKALTE